MMTGGRVWCASIAPPSFLRPRLAATDPVVVDHNFLGTDATGTRPIPNGTGVELIGSNAKLYVGNTRGDLWTDMAVPVEAPSVQLPAEATVLTSPPRELQSPQSQPPSRRWSTSGGPGGCRGAPRRRRCGFSTIRRRCSRAPAGPPRTVRSTR